MNVYRRTIFFTHFIIFIQILTASAANHLQDLRTRGACFFKKLGDISKSLPAF